MYKLGKANIVADALSRRDTEEEAEGVVLTLSAPRFDFVAHLRQAQDSDPAMVALREDITGGSRSAPWSIVNGMV